uniref:Uncharacterized protein n=1 Tax=Anguilla anguilla TaxID=7936 RepID=A0A0E9P707_ANGAN
MKKYVFCCCFNLATPKTPSTYTYNYTTILMIQELAFQKCKKTAGNFREN